MNAMIRIILIVTARIRVRPFRRSTYAVALLLYTACASVPPQVAKLQQKELEIIVSLRQSHLAMVDAYVDQKVLVFESWFFQVYGPVFIDDWRAKFRELNGRDYEESSDFRILYNDLVAEYQTEVSPIEEIRRDLREAISREYRHTVAAHEAVGAWIDSMEKLNGAQKDAIDRLLGAIKPGLSLELVDRAVEEAKSGALTKISKLTGDES